MAASFNYLCRGMIRKIYSTILILLLACSLGLAQRELQTFGSGGTTITGEETEDPELQEEDGHGHDHGPKKNIPSIIRTWEVTNYGANLETAELDTSLNFFHVYNPIFKRSISNGFTGNVGGAYLSNDFFSRQPASDFYLFRSYDAYLRLPESVRYFNTTTPYTMLDYSQSENRNTRNETRFNVFHSQNVNPKFNFAFLYDQTKATGHYQHQENKFHNIGFISSYISDQYRSHFNLIFNRYQSQENGGLQPGQDLNEYKETETYLVNMLNANSEISNNTISFSNEYRLGKREEKGTEEGEIYESFRPITGFIHQLEYSGNERTYTDTDANLEFYPNAYLNRTATNDTIIYRRFTNVFQLKFYESPDRKYTFSKRAFIGNDLIAIEMLQKDSLYWPEHILQIPNLIGSTLPDANSPYLKKAKYHNIFVGGGISRDEGQFWKWNAQGKIYITGYRSGQTELSAYVYKPLRIGKDTTSLYLAGELNTIVPDFFIQEFRSNHYQWKNRFDNTNEMIIRSRIHSQQYKLSVGMNYALISNYIYNDTDALPNQGSREMLVLAAYANKDVESKHWLLRAQVLWQKSSEENYLHLPQLTGYLSLNYKTVVSKVLYTNLGVDVRYHSEYFTDAYDPATGRFYWQNQQKIGNFPFVDLHANLKLKRTRAFLQWMNAAAGLLDGDFWAAPNYPMYRRTFRLGIAWSFYD